MLKVIQLKIVRPIRGLLQHGASPERLAWSLAVGAAVGINPLLGSTTVLALALAGIFRLNVVASQVTNHAVYPLELLLFPVWIKLGSIIFGTAALPLSRTELMEGVRHHLWATTKTLWSWEWHGLVVWAAAMCLVVPILKMAMLPALRRASKRISSPSNQAG